MVTVLKVARVIFYTGLGASFAAGAYKDTALTRQKLAEMKAAEAARERARALEEYERKLNAAVRQAIADKLCASQGEDSPESDAFLDA